ncbi:MAG: tRNA (N(6)-L-threonylcarbamoyladenosine(37)-C(2))-methylthiotransferase MtaB [Alphaproteobacteria bacterium]|jgi:threonylcarbamoyladenosine tRNA methylthiotransferase MtaB
MSGRKPDIITFGCRLNAYESEVMRAIAGSEPAENTDNTDNDDGGGRDRIIVNTCAVTAEAERQARQAIRRARRDRPNAEIIVTGCAAQIDPARFAAMPEVDRVLGNVEKLTPEAYISTAPVLVTDIMTATETAGHLIDGFDGRARAFVQVQQGCDHRCTFCIIPFGRGDSRSSPLDVITTQINKLVDSGVQEVVLSGVDLTAYGADLPGRPNLGGAVRHILKQSPDLQRLRLSSIDCIEIDDDLMGLIGDDPRLMPHFHLSLQAGSDMILKRMKRRHLRADAVALCARIRERRPDVVFGADFIAGFPTETEAMFDDTLALVDDCGLTWLHVFPFSARPGTPAARMPAAPMATRRERAARLRAAGAKAERQHLDQNIGATARVLIETQGRGRTEHFAPVTLEGATASLDNTIVDVVIDRRDEQKLVAHLATMDPVKNSVERPAP